jgi:hypothetical protein
LHDRLEQEPATSIAVAHRGQEHHEPFADGMVPKQAVRDHEQLTEPVLG